MPWPPPHALPQPAQPHLTRSTPSASTSRAQAPGFSTKGSPKPLWGTVTKAGSVLGGKATGWLCSAPGVGTARLLGTAWPAGWAWPPTHVRGRGGEGWGEACVGLGPGGSPPTLTVGAGGKLALVVHGDPPAHARGPAVDVAEDQSEEVRGGHVQPCHDPGLRWGGVGVERRGCSSLAIPGPALRPQGPARHSASHSGHSARPQDGAAPHPPGWVPSARSPSS